MEANRWGTSLRFKNMRGVRKRFKKFLPLCRNIISDPIDKAAGCRLAFTLALVSVRENHD